MGQIFFSDSDAEAKKLSRLYKQGKLSRIHSGIYTDELEGNISSLVQKKWMYIVAHIAPGAIISFRTAHDLKPYPFEGEEKIVFLTGTYSKLIKLPGLIINIIKGDPTCGIVQVLPYLSCSNKARIALENLSTVRGKKFHGIKTIGYEHVEEYLAKELYKHNEDFLNGIRDEAKELSIKLNYKKEMKILNQIISSLLSTHDIDTLQNPYAKSVAVKEPYDQSRIEVFEQLATYLQECNFVDREYKYKSTSFKNISFFESYFSNYIEGTEFIIDEAEDIVFARKEIYNRHADSHDVLAAFDLTNDILEMSATPHDADSLLLMLKSRHRYLMSERVEINPGEFKTRQNRAGNTHFVEPDCVIGTLSRGFDIYKTLDTGLPRALFMQFLISEVHPFNDGNGRIARIMMNSELVAENLYKIALPTVLRDSYISSLRRATRDNFFNTYCKVMDIAHAYTSILPWGDYAMTRERIELNMADQLPDDGFPIFNRVIKELKLSILGD